MIRYLDLKNFAAFSKVRMEFSPKINVILGENGTGKTQIMKAAYGLLKATSNIDSAHAKKDIHEQRITEKFVRIFRPLDHKLGKIWRRGSEEKAQAEVGFNEGWTRSSFNYNSKNVDLQELTSYPYSPIFIPTKEVLSLYRGILSPESDKETVKALFDDTYIDLCEHLSKPIEKPVDERLGADPRFGTVYPKIVDAIDGRYEIKADGCLFHSGCYLERKKRFDAKHSAFYSDSTKYVFSAEEGDDLSAAMTAEGFRKIGIIQHLLANESLAPQNCGVLFWDEPESNLNPKLMQLMVESLLELSRNGLQIVIATHDYTTLKWLDLLNEKGKDDHVRYHSLYREEDSGEIMLHSTDDYLAIRPNAIAETFSEITDHEISRTMGGLGK